MHGLASAMGWGHRRQLGAQQSVLERVEQGTECSWLDMCRGSPRLRWEAAQAAARRRRPGVQRSAAHLADRAAQAVHRRRVGGGALQDAAVAADHLLPAVAGDPLRAGGQMEHIGVGKGKSELSTQ